MTWLRSKEMRAEQQETRRRGLGRDTGHSAVREHTRPGQYVALAILSAVGLFIIFPYIWMVLTSFKDTREIVQNPGVLLPINWTVAGYRNVLQNSPFFRWLLNSSIVSVSITALVVFTSTLAGFVFAKFDFKGKTFLFWFILATMMVPYQITMIPIFLIVGRLGLYDTLGALILPEVASAFGFYLSRQFIEEIPDSVCEAALIDGAGPLRTYWSVIVPLIRPAIAALAIFTFLEAWNEYLKPLIMLSAVERMRLPLSLAFFSNAHIHDIGSVMSASSLIMIPAVIVLLIFQKQFIKGIAITGSK